MRGERGEGHVGRPRVLPNQQAPGLGRRGEGVAPECAHLSVRGLVGVGWGRACA